MKEKYNFSNKTAIITGATSGMGEEVAKSIVKIGGNVVISGRNMEKGMELQRSLGKKSLFYQGDIADPTVNRELVKKALDHFGSLDFLVMAAGRLGVAKLDELEIEDWQKTIEVNLNAVFYLLKFALPAMKNPGASIVVIGSVASRNAFPNHPAYAASKSALSGLVRQVALDYGPDIRINLITPAQVDTPLLRNSVKAFKNPESIIEETKNALPLKRLGTVTDISHAVTFLLSEDASWVTGTDFVIDGGFLV